MRSKKTQNTSSSGTPRSSTCKNKSSKNTTIKKSTKAEEHVKCHPKHKKAAKGTAEEQDCWTPDARSFVEAFLQVQYGRNTSYNTSQPTQKILLRMASQLCPYKTVSPFDRRVTALAWHPSQSSVLAAGSKGGEIIFWNYNQPCNVQVTIPGIGPGGSVTSMKFDNEKPTFIYTTSVCGKVMLQDFEGKNSACFLDTFTWENWFSCMDVSPQRNLLAAGDTKGALYMVASKDGSLVWKVPKKIHKSKISHVEFHQLNPDLLVTSSIDHTVKLWDMRKMDTEKDSLCVLQHNKGLNSANFSYSSGSLLLTTDQHQELRVYKGPLWQSKITIPHPHRHFQHLTPIKASWHPCMDVVVVGRYPDAHFQAQDKRCIDFFDGHTGELKYQLSSPFVSGIVSLNQFNFTGDALASGTGSHVVVWRPKDEDELCSPKNSRPLLKGNKKSNKTPQNSRKEKLKSKCPLLQKKIKTR